MNYKPLNLKSVFYGFILLMTSIIISLITMTSSVSAKENTVIKVGYPIVTGFTEFNNGNYSGYAFEYLLEISRYTGWQYEFIEMPLSDALEKLQNGELDIVAGMIKNEKTTELFDFPELNSGYTYSTLATLQSNTLISRSDSSTLNGIKVGYFDKSIPKLSKLKDFFENNDITNVTYISYPSTDSEALIKALNNKEVDAIVTGDLLLNNGLKVLTKFDSSPYYFATTKGKSEIVKTLNKAIEEINEYEPSFIFDLYNKYFENQIDNSVIFTKEEQEYLSNITSLKAIYVDNFTPIQYYDESTKEAKGIIVDISKVIFQKLGVNFELIKANNYEEAYELLKENKDFLAIGFPISYESSKINDLLFTKSYLDLSIIKVYSKKASNNIEDQILALPYGYGYNDLNTGYKIKYYATIEDCLLAVEKNEASLTYGNYYTISNYIATSYFSNLSIVTSNYSIVASLALSPDSDRTLFNILNKAITSISTDDINNIIYNNLTNTKASITLKSFFLSNLTLCLTTISMILIIISILIGIIVRMRFNNLKKGRNLLISKSQTDQLSGLYNRSTCKELINSYFAKFTDLYYCFLIIDIDHFKEVNDTLGHMVGDEVLKEFSGLLKKVFSNEDVICRLGGDEFIVFIKNIPSDSLDIIEKTLCDLCNYMNKEVAYNGNAQKISISVGAFIDNEKSSFDKLYEKSDKLLYEVKRNGRNGFKINTYL